MEPEKRKEHKRPAKSIRKPVQSRSINTKEKILETALELFCKKGYYNTTTNEIAQKAQVSIGSLYSYFEDKDTIFFEILEKYNAKFDMAKSDVWRHPELLRSDPRAWLRALIDSLIRVHEETRELNRELNVLSYYNPKVAGILKKYRAETMKTTIGYFMKFKDELKTEDIEAAATVVFDLLSATVDRIVFGHNEIDRNRLIEAAIDVVYKYFDLSRFENGN